MSRVRACIDVIDAPIAYDRKRVLAERADPLRGVLLVSPGAPVLLVHQMRSLFESRHNETCFSFLCDWIAAVSGELAIGGRFLAGLGKGDKLNSAKPYVPSSAVDHPYAKSNVSRPTGRPQGRARSRPHTDPISLDCGS